MKTVFQHLILALLVFLLACSKNDDQPWEQKTIELDEKSAQLVESGNEFGLELFQTIYSNETKYDNLMVSPLSVSLALAMTYNGANGETQTAMKETLKLKGLTSEEINASYKNLITALKSLDPKVVFEIANAIFYKEGFTVESDFVANNKNYYDAEVKALDFNSPDALKTINGWVDDKTHGKIEKIIDNISSEHVMFLINAIYFNGIWQNKFNKDNTQNLPFYLSSEGAIVDIPTMVKTDAVQYISNDLFSSVKLAYGAGNYNMIVFLPTEQNSLESVIEQLDKTNWEKWNTSFNDTFNVDIKLPRLEYAYEIELNEVLTQMGMGVAFTNSANFNGINTAGNLKIDKVKHKTYIKVDEKGTEAAAVTSVGMVATSIGPTQNIQFNVNRPFLYAITEKDTNAILFMGTVKNPIK